MTFLFWVSYWSRWALLIWGPFLPWRNVTVPRSANLNLFLNGFKWWTTQSDLRKLESCHSTIYNLENCSRMKKTLLNLHMKETYVPKSQGRKRRPEGYLPVSLVHAVLQRAPHSCRQSHSPAHPHTHRYVFCLPQTPADEEPAVWSFPFNCHPLVERQFRLNCKQRHWLSLYSTWFSQEYWLSEEPWKLGFFSVQYNKSNIFLRGQGKASLLPIIKESDNLSSESLSCNITHCLCRVTWPSLCSAVGSGTNAGVWLLLLLRNPWN